MPDTIPKPKTGLSEESFNKFLPEDLQRISKIHFTPIRIARIATEWLTEDGKKNVLDIGAGIGKFCITGALNSDSFFCGIEYRPSLVKVANDLIETFEIQNAIVYNQNITDIDFTDFDAFYLYNPFYENIVYKKRMNNEVPLADSFYRNYLDYTVQQLENCKKGSRIVTFHGDNLEVPGSFEIKKISKNGLLKLWIKM